MSLDDFLARLGQPKKAGHGWVARCPAHHDRSPSLSIALGAGDRILVFCHAGCRVEDIAAAVGYRVGDLFQHPWKGLPPVDQTWFRVIDVRAAISLARRQPGGQDDIQRRYLCHDLLKFVERARLTETQYGLDAADWDTLATLADIEREAHAILEELSP